MEEFIKEINQVMEKHGISMRPTINFPLRTRIPWRAKLAIWTINRLGGQLIMRFVDKKHGPF